ncbi:armadillo repeat-containing protein 2 isoform X2 [Anthonomus grandis grandis]|uniref:armadillo repeat-containing protein 2 isoform X2 n=1 Tax=Anthonomus grandis grandis TaxID=2921223 RepID=UPI002165994A|nr:armadillo repeat-containing protein 2 isoform X2 [Anthonomus grandis grandis]
MMEFKNFLSKPKNPVNFSPGYSDGQSSTRKTSAEIINEARLAIKECQNPETSYSSSGIKPLQTQRPFTPRDKERHLYGSKKAKGDRPPSSFSLRYLQNETDLPVTPPDKSSNLFTPHHVSKHPPTPRIDELRTHNRSSSLGELNGSIFNIGVKETCKIRLPSLDNRLLQKRKTFQNTSSLDNLPEESEINNTEKAQDTRKAFSSPQERTDFDQSGDFSKPITKQSTLSECLLLGPQNLTKIFDNKQIVEHSETLFTSTGYLTNQLNNLHNKRGIATDPVTNDLKPRTIDDILKNLNKIDLQNYDDETVKALLEELYEFMENDGMLNSKVSSKLKIVILKSLYRFVESKNEQILISIAQVILAIKVTGNNLSGVCKLIFKISKNDHNDNLFFRKNLLELFLDALGRSSPLDDAEACVYAYGALKFLTMNGQLLQKVVELGILPLMVLHIKIINNAKQDKAPLPKQTNHVLFQLTGALRNLVSEEHIYDSFIFCGTVFQVCQSLELFCNDQDIVANISRTLSTISTNDVCCDSLVEIDGIYKIFIKLFGLYETNEEIIVRLAYTLGNIVAKIDNSRVKFFHEENSINSLLTLWTTYLERTLQLCSLKLENQDVNNGASEDVMIKVIRVIANVVINPEIGQLLNEKFGNRLIDEFLKVLISNPFKKNQELVLSILSTLNNLSYYYSSDLELDVFHVKQIDIAEGIMEYTRSRNSDCIIETMRILGNLSRSKITRNYISETEIFNTLIHLLDTDEPTLLKTTIGVFVNLMSDNKARKLFKNKAGVSKLVEILTKFCENDWSLGSLICQVLWNYCIDTVDLYELFSEGEIHQLLVLLADHLDEEKLFGIDEVTREMELFVTQEYLIWEEFANVATNLLEKIEYFLDTFDQIQIEDNEKSPRPVTKESSTNVSYSAW